MSLYINNNKVSLTSAHMAFMVSHKPSKTLGHLAVHDLAAYLLFKVANPTMFFGQQSAKAFVTRYQLRRQIK